MATLLQGEWDDLGNCQRVLVMGDAAKINERSLIGFDHDEEWIGWQSNLWLKMGHHGSRSSNCCRIADGRGCLACHTLTRRRRCREGEQQYCEAGSECLAPASGAGVWICDSIRPTKISHF
ncbi:hypothetical protein [Nocardia sp. NBC_01009]|uniref:hypothetical protein n=1 Tax=Nocardia sp. NBC_01009 TaxID=2975996 RepID=UPI003865674B|nr:hypothetical protein OHA42_23465 [Nocardia sp. NBC_01009]